MHEHQEHAHGHGHANDQGVRGMLRYLRFAPQMWRSEVNDAVVELLDPRAGERVVDIGAGMGAGTVIAARTAAEVVAVEPTPFMRRTLRARRVFQRARNNITVVDASAEHLPVDDRSVDAIWAVNTMHHWVDPERGSAEIARVLRPEGRVVLVDENFEDPSHPEYERFSADHGDEHHGFTMVDAARMGELLTAAGLIDVDASMRTVAGRPTISVTASAPADS
jgi:SAM-dependent methyltransferase